MRRFASPWLDCVLWLFAAWLAGLTVTVSGMVLERVLSPGPWFRTLFKIAPNVAGTGLVVFLGLAASREIPSAVLALRKPAWRALPWVVLSAFCLALLAAGLNTWIEWLLPMPPVVQALFEQILEFHTLAQFLGVILLLVVVAPVTEELMFRGLFLHRLGERHGSWTAILGSALSFGVFHLLPWQAVGAALVGIYLGWLVARTGSVFMSMAAHACFNLVPVIATGLSTHLPAVRGLGAGSEEIRLTPGLLIGAALALVAGILGTLRSTRDRLPGDDSAAPGLSEGPSGNPEALPDAGASHSPDPPVPGDGSMPDRQEVDS